MNRRFDKLLVLDLDETLISATAELPIREADFRVFMYSVLMRPGLGDFIRDCLDWFEVGVWTSATEDYANAVCSRIFPSLDMLAFLWGRQRCTRRVDQESREEYMLKDLRKLQRKGYRLEKVIAVEDDSRKLSRNYGNLVSVRPYFGAPDDSELPMLSRYLEILGAVENVRTVEKRNWREIAALRTG